MSSIGVFSFCYHLKKGDLFAQNWLWPSYPLHTQLVAYVHLHPHSKNMQAQNNNNNNNNNLSYI